jgi:hypothetical protein
MDDEKKNLPRKIPVEDKMRNLELENSRLRVGYAQCIDDLEASNKMLVQHLGMDPVQLTGEVLGHRSVLATASGGTVSE